MDKAKLEPCELKDQAVVQKGQLKNILKYLFLMKNNKIHKLKINHRIFQQDIKSRTNIKNLLFLWLCLIS